MILAFKVVGVDFYVWTGNGYSRANYANLLPFKPGDTITIREVDDSLKSLWVTHRFEEVSVELKDDIDGKRAIFYLKPAVIIRRVKVEAEGDAKGELYKHFKAFLGKPLYLVELECEDIVKKLGYAECSVELKGSTLRVKAKKLIRLRRVETIPPIRIDYKREEVITSALLKRLREKVERSLVDAGYYNARIDGPEVDDGIVRFYISKGDKFKVKFKLKHEHLEPRSILLMHIKPVFSPERFKEILVSELKRKGFKDAKINMRVERGEEVRVIYEIDEGPRYYVKKIDGLPDDLKPVIKTKEKGIRSIFSESWGVFSEDVLKEDLESLREWGIEHGYPDFKVDVEKEFEGHDVTLHFKVSSGRRLIVGKVEIFGELSTGILKKLKQIHKIELGSWLDLYKVERGAVRMERYLKNTGFLDAKVRYEVETYEDERIANIIYKVAPDRRYILRRIIPRGNIRTKESVVIDNMTLNPGEYVSSDKLNESVRLLYTTGYFDNVSLKLIKYSGRNADVAVDLTEGRTRSVGGFVGFSTSEGIRSGVEFSMGNLLGRALDTEISGKVSYWVGWPNVGGFEEPGFTSALASFKMMRRRLFLGTDLNLSAFFPEFVRTPNYEVEKLGAETMLSREVVRNIRINLALRSESRVREEGLDKVPKLVAIEPSCFFNRKDKAVSPKSEDFAGLKVSIGSSGFVAVRIAGSIMRLKKPWGINIKGGTGAIFGRKEYIPVESRFFLGGGGTIRGFEEDRIGSEIKGGTRMIIGSFELLSPEIAKMRIAAFFDAGSTWDKFSNIRESIGLGLRYNTPLGYLRFDIGFKLDKKKDEKLLLAHFSIGTGRMSLK